MHSAVKFPYDAATAFKALDSDAVTATETSEPLELDYITKGRGDVNNRLGGQAYAVVVHVSDLELGTGDESYELEVVVDDTVDLSDSPETVASLTISETGTYAIYLDADTMEKVVEGDGPVAMGVKATLGGTSPSITHAAWLAPVVS